jgi:hypothetical protein
MMKLSRMPRRGALLVRAARDAGFVNLYHITSRGSLGDLLELTIDECHALAGALIEAADQALRSQPKESKSCH